MRNLVKILVGLLIGVVVAPHVDIGAGLYLWSVALTVVSSFALLFILGALLMVRGGRNVSIESTAILASIVCSLVADYKLGFSLHAIVVLSVTSLISRFVCEMIWPTHEEA